MIRKTYNHKNKQTSWPTRNDKWKKSVKPSWISDWFWLIIQYFYRHTDFMRINIRPTAKNLLKKWPNMFWLMKHLRFKKWVSSSWNRIGGYLLDFLISESLNQAHNLYECYEKIVVSLNQEHNFYMKVIEKTV